MINPEHLKNYIIIPALEGLHQAGIPYSDEAVDLLLGTAAVESNMGYYLHQEGGPAQGVFQMEPDTEADNWNNYIGYREDLRNHMVFRYGQGDGLLISHLEYQAAQARIWYYRIDDPLPRRENYSDTEDYILALATYWKQHYNTEAGAGTVDKFMNSHYRIFGGQTP